MKYVTYDSAGKLTGAYWQDLLPEHASGAIEVDDDQYRNWTAYEVVNGQLQVKPAATPAEVLAGLKTSQLASINAAYAAADLGAFTFAGKAIQADARSQSKIFGVNGIVATTGALPAVGWPGGWQAADNSFVPITDVATWKSFFAAMVNQGTANFLHAQNLKDILAQATTPEQVAAITW